MGFFCQSRKLASRLWQEKTMVSGANAGFVLATTISGPPQVVLAGREIKCEM